MALIHPDIPRERLLCDYRDGLLQDTIPFWLERCQGYLDHEYGGYCHIVDREGIVYDTDKSVWAQGRNVWLWATLYNTVERREAWREAAALGVRFIDEHCFDPQDGRMWFHVARDGTPVRKRRYSFSESFAAIAYAAWARLTGETRYAEKAVSCFQQFLNHSPSPKYASSRESMGFVTPVITITTAQSLRQDIGYGEADAIIDRAIQTIETHFVKDDIRAVMEQVKPDGSIINHIDGRTLNPGHAIEGAWFILDEAMHRNGDSRLVDLGCRMIDYMWERGWDEKYGGIRYFVDVFGKPVQEYWHAMKFWWPHNEATIAYLMAYLITGEPRYAQRHAYVHRWAHEHFHDKINGEWFGYLNHDGTVSNTAKGNLWKSPFHLPRMQWRCWQLLQGRTERSDLVPEP